MVRTRATAAMDGQPPPPSVFDLDAKHATDEEDNGQPDTKRRKTTSSITLADRTLTKKAGPVKYYCYTCDTERVATAFPDYNPTDDCDHLINTCKACLKDWIAACVEGGQLPTVRANKDDSDSKDESHVVLANTQVKTMLGVHCPECTAVMHTDDVQRSAAKRVFDRFDQLNRKHIGENTPGWMWCLSPHCNAGQVHEPGSKIKEEPIRESGKAKALWKKAKKALKPTKRTAAEDSDVIVVCHACSAKACGSCVRPWHEGESCADYQKRVKEQHVKEEEQALKALQKYTKKCPGCSVNVQRNGGCPAMHCTRCNTMFCWNCLEILSRNGYCKCHPAPAMQPFQQAQTQTLFEDEEEMQGMFD